MTDKQKPSLAEKARKIEIANILRKLQSGKTLSAQERQLLIIHTEAEADDKKPKKPHGNTGKSRGKPNPDDRIAANLKYPPPKDLSKEARRVWVQVMENTAASHFHPADLPLVRNYCILQGRLEAMIEQWDGSPTTTKTNGDVMINPTMTAITRLESSVMALAGKLRICPSARISPQKAGWEKEVPSIGKFDGLLG